MPTRIHAIGDREQPDHTPKPTSSPPEPSRTSSYNRTQATGHPQTTDRSELGICVHTRHESAIGFIGAVRIA